MISRSQASLNLRALAESLPSSPASSVETTPPSVIARSLVHDEPPSVSPAVSPIVVNGVVKSWKAYHSLTKPKDMMPDLHLPVPYYQHLRSNPRIFRPLPLGTGVSNRTNPLFQLLAQKSPSGVETAPSNSND